MFSQIQSLLAAFESPWDCGVSPRKRALLAFRLGELHQRAPRELELKTGQVVVALALSAGGLTRNEIVSCIYPHFKTVSPQYQASLVEATNKLIQRTRLRFRRFGIVVRFDRPSGRFVAEGEECDGQKIPMASPCPKRKTLHCDAGCIGHGRA